MKCDKVQALHGAYLDSELDAKATFEIERHLATCPACARVFTEEERLEARIMAGLNRGTRTATLWEQIERSVVSAAPLSPDLFAGCEDSTQRRKEPQRVAEGSLSLRSAAYLCVSALTRLQAGWQASRWAWAGLAAMWVGILALNLAAREPGAPLVAGQELPSASEMGFALKQKQLLMAGLTVTSEPAPADRPKAALPSPRSDRHSETLNA
jgi:anti-sigma factor RsiW